MAPAAVSAAYSGSGPKALLGIPYDDVRPGKAPIPITIAPTPSPARLGVHPSLRPSSSPEPGYNGSFIARSKLHDDVRRDSGLAPSSSTARESFATFATDGGESIADLRHSQSLPRINSGTGPNTSSLKISKQRRSQNTAKADNTYEIPKIPEASFLKSNQREISFEDLASPGKIEFSKRGSMLVSGKKANESNQATGGRSFKIRVSGSRMPKSTLLQRIPSRELSHEDEILSQKVRLMYETGTDDESALSFVRLSGANTAEIEEEALADDSSSRPPSRSQNDHLSAPQMANQRKFSSNSKRDSFIQRENLELAGGIEDWSDVKQEDVDRYGFIVPRSIPESAEDALDSTPPPKLHRVTTALQLASDAPRKQRKIGRALSVNGSTRSMGTLRSKKSPGAGPMRPTSSQSSYRSTTSGPSKVRSVANRLPHNKDRRCIDEAGDMLTLAPGLADISVSADVGKGHDAMKRKEWQREEKWRKMAKVVKTNNHGGGMVFEFDTKNTKLVERTWKGIPDRWRATAWHSFLSASAKKRPGSPTDEELKATFLELVEQSSPDDMQIDLDVPRTINSHIMFRRRYRGGQRLLFRVLHALSIYFPVTGYVQGMAALAATFLCYYDEEMAFVMLARMWELRGLARLYQSGFQGLMHALDEFEKQWLEGGEVATKLTNLNITPTAYGTRWYLTIFNYSIPFPAQLRVWDVFLLLGDPEPNTPPSSLSPDTQDPSFHGMIDVLHATSAALIDGTREILLDSDFESAMKVLTSWIPVRDEELLMRVAKTEWKVHRRKNKAG